MGFLIEPLAITLPIGAFNGSAIVDAQLKPIEQHLIAPNVAQLSIDVLNQFGVDIWLFTNERWYTRNPDGEYVPHEKRAIKADPTSSRISRRFSPASARSSAPVPTRRCWRTAKRRCSRRSGRGDCGSIADLLFDVTPAGHDKGTFVAAMAKRLGIQWMPSSPSATCRTIWQCSPKSGVSFAMGNATDDVKKHATHVTDSNERDGFARAIETVLELG